MPERRRGGSGGSQRLELAGADQRAAEMQQRGHNVGAALVVLGFWVAAVDRIAPVNSPTPGSDTNAVDRGPGLAVAGVAALTASPWLPLAPRRQPPMGNATAMGVQAPGMARSGARPDVPSSPRSRLPVFVLDKGRFTAFDAPGQKAAEFQRINNRGEIVGSYSKGTRWTPQATGRQINFKAPGDETSGARPRWPADGQTRGPPGCLPGSMQRLNSLASS
jgi:hypothetical protein